MSQDAHRKALNRILFLVDQGKTSAAIAMANGLRDVLGIPRGQTVEGIVRNGAYFQVALRDRSGGSQVVSLGPDGSAWKLNKGQWEPVPSHGLPALAEPPREGTQPAGVSVPGCLLPFIQAVRW